jgi:transcriptional regulator with XRE-family HTH domain
MSRPAKAVDIGTAILCIRDIADLTQKGLAALSGVHEVSICRYEQGNERPSPRSLTKILEALGVPEPEFAALVEVIGRVRKAMTTEGSAGELPEFPAGLTRFVQEVVALIDRNPQPLPLEAVRHRAPSLLERLSRRSSRERALLLEECPEFRSWGVVELLCKKSVELAGSSPEQSLAQAQFALEVAASIEGDPHWQGRVEGFALVHCANAKRVAGFPREAETIFKKGKRLWEAGRSADPGIFDEALVLMIEASLRKELRELPEALRLIEQALEADTGQLRRELLTNKATILKHLGEYDPAIEILEQVIPLLREDEGSRLFAIVEVKPSGDARPLRSFPRGRGNAPSGSHSRPSARGRNQPHPLQVD